MNGKRFSGQKGNLFILLALVILPAGCRPQNPSASAAPPERRPAPMQTVARLHWLGLDRLSRETNAASLMAIWNLAESRKLEQQTLDKLSRAPWPWLHRGPDTNAAAFMRPLLDDVVSNESCLEIRSATNQPAELVFAIRLDDRRAALWQTNLARVLESLTGIQPAPAPDNHSGWSLKKHHVPNLIELARAGDWTLLGAAEDHNGLLDEWCARIQRGQAPSTLGNSNDWLAADVDLRRAGGVVAPGRELCLPQIALIMTGDGKNVVTYGTLDFPGPLALDLKPWNIPTNLIDERLSSFTIIRGFQPWLASLPAWTNLDIGPPPDQFCFWALPGLKMLSYFTAPLPDASNEVDRLATVVLQNQKRWFATNSPAKFGRSAPPGGLEWKGLPYMFPFLSSTNINHQSFIFGGGFQPEEPAPLSLQPLQTILNRTNEVYYDWELTGPRTEQWFYMGQFARFVLNKAQLPAGAPGLTWLQAVGPKLGVSVTGIAQTAPTQLSFTRHSTIGFTGIELNLLADWLESPQFPGGLYTLLAPPPNQF